MMGIVLILLLCISSFFFAAWLIATILFNSKDHGEYDSPKHPSTGKRASESVEHEAAAKAIAKGFAEPPPAKGREMLRILRKYLDENGETAKINSEVRPVDVSGVMGEWVIAPNVESSRRLLYIHGGGYVMGSAKSQRPITSRMSEISNSAVLSIDYRLMPENSRMAGIEDCRTAYEWILENGPHGPSPADMLVVAGDSSGGNLALATIAWARDTGLRSADAVIALCPQTDATFGSPSLKKNIDTDVMQGKSFGPVIRAPKMLSLWIAFLMHKIRPSSRLVSPLLGDLSGLPPTLLQVSEVEMFLDDSIRYANKANTQGSCAVVQTWPFVMHVWHAFDVPEAGEAFEKMEEFIAEHVSGGDAFQDPAGD